MLKLIGIGTFVLLFVMLLAMSGTITGNVSSSVPAGLYVKASPDQATFVTFCLTDRQSGQPFYKRFCSPDAPGKIRILKRIETRHADGSLTVRGDKPRSIDSAIVGRVQPDQMQGYWRHFGP